MPDRQLGTEAVPRPGADATAVLTVYLVLLLGIPSPMVISPLGSAGAPSTIMALGTAFLWAWFHVRRDRPVGWGHQPVRVAAIGWLLVMLLVYVQAMSSPLPADEISPGDSGMLRVVALVGLVLLANDGITSVERVRVLLGRVVLAVGVVAALGLFQYATKQLWIDRIEIPGLTNGAAEWTLAQRSGLTRPSGTATHPIEYGVVLTIVLPLAVTFAMQAPSRRWLYRAILAAVAFAILLSISRSAIVCAAVALLVLALSWSARARLRGLVLVAAAFLAVYVTTPGVLGTITRLFTGASDDSSITSRTDSYDLAAEFVARDPLLGRGFGTFLPKYRILDNGWLGLLIEGGVVGVLGLVVLVVVAGWAARRARRLAQRDFDRALGQALLAAVAAGACSLLFFDTFGFPQSAGCFFLMIGLAGVLRRLTVGERVPHATSREVPAGAVDEVREPVAPVSPS